MIYAVSYEVIGSPCTGVYLVNAKTRSQAMKLVLKINDDYVCRGDCAELLGTYDVLFALDIEELYGISDIACCLTHRDLIAVFEPNSTHCISSGT